MDNYHLKLQINTSADKLYDALTNGIPNWWTTMFEGSANRTNNTFTVRFGDSIFKTMQIEELVINSKVVWYVKDSLINIPELNNQTEWIGTTIIWELTPTNNFTELQLTHLGLHPKIECYHVCTSGWQQFTARLKSYAETEAIKLFQ